MTETESSGEKEIECAIERHNESSSATLREPASSYSSSSFAGAGAGGAAK